MRCPECQRQLKVPAKMAGKRVPCPACKAMLVLPKVVSEPTRSPDSVPLTSLDHDLDDIGFKLADEIPKSKLKTSNATERTGGNLPELQEKEYSYPCKVCGTMMYARPSDIGSMVHCPDCYAEYPVPGPPPVKLRPRDPDLNSIPNVSLMPVQATGTRTNEFGRSTAEDYLAKAKKEVELENRDEREQVYDFDTAGWMKRTFAFLGDSTLIVVALTTGLFMGGTMVGSVMAGNLMPNASDSARLFGVMMVLILLGLPLLIITLANGIAVLEASANKLKRIGNWPVFHPSDALGEIAVVIGAFSLSVLPGGLISWFGSSIGISSEVGTGVVFFSAYLLFPIVLLGMLDNQSLGEPYSPAVLGSMNSKFEAWGAMYLLNGLAMVAVFILYLVATIGSVVSNFIFGMLIPIIVFFIFHQIGVLGSRIASVTNLDFEGEASDEEEESEPKKVAE